MIAWVTGFLSEKEKQKSISLKNAYAALREKTELLVEYEDNARNNERYKIMGELAETVAHEVRTPLSALQGAVEIVTSEKSDDQVKKKFSKTIFTEIQRINDVIKDFLDLGKIQVPSLKTLNLKSFLSECLNLLQPVLNKNNIKLSIDIPSHLNIFVNENQLKQVIINLIINSVAAISHTHGQINITAEEADGFNYISFIDNGEGIKEKDIINLFIPFSTTKKDGSGLGLYLSRNIIRSFGGELDFNKEHLNDTQFIVKLPAKSS